MTWRPIPHHSTRQTRTRQRREQAYRGARHVPAKLREQFNPAKHGRLRTADDPNPSSASCSSDRPSSMANVPYVHRSVLNASARRFPGGTEASDGPGDVGDSGRSLGAVCELPGARPGAAEQGPTAGAKPGHRSELRVQHRTALGGIVEVRAESSGYAGKAHGRIRRGEPATYAGPRAGTPPECRHTRNRQARCRKKRPRHSRPRARWLCWSCSSPC